MEEHGLSGEHVAENKRVAMKVGPGDSIKRPVIDYFDDSTPSRYTSDGCLGSRGRLPLGPVPMEATPTHKPGSQVQRSAEVVLSMLAPRMAATVGERLRRERIHTAADLAILDREDLRELGLTMVERSRVVLWARQTHYQLDVRSEESIGSRVRGDSFSLENMMEMPVSPALHPKSQHHDKMTRSFSLENEGLCEEDTDVSELLQHLDDVESRWDFWCNLVKESAAPLKTAVQQVEGVLHRRGSDAARQDHQGDLRENVLEKLFDLSSERLQEVYDSVDKDSDGLILKEELLEGLHRCELSGMDDGTVEKVLDVVGHGKSSMKLQEFESVLTRLKMAQLLSATRYENQAASDWLSIMDYNSQRIIEQRLCLRDYFFGHRRREFPMRWVHLHKFDLTLLLALTIKYQLHPLSVEDVVDQATTKLDRYGGHYFMAIEHFEIVGSTNGQEPVQVRGRHFTLFCAGPPHLDTILTVTQDDRSFSHDWPGETPSVLGSKEDGWVTRLHKRLRAVRSRSRERRTDFLMYEIIDLCTDDMIVVVRVYTARLKWLEDRFNMSKMGTEQSKVDWFNEVVLIKLQLAVVMRRLRGLQRILRRLMDDPDFASQLSGYLADVADHVNEALEGAGHLTDMCVALSEAYEHAEERAQNNMHRDDALARGVQDDRMNRLLGILTILTTVFTPLTFVAGVYGMNFVNQDGKPTIPELLLPNGYRDFWIFTIAYLVMASIVGCWIWRKVSGSVRKSELARNMSKGEASWGTWAYKTNMQNPTSSYAAMP
mmetsp:Transcript_96889/g.192073  ORF Transcript_96889/g.192073 Transcript_96889/m.192073 type:complete len:772 (+) Transcript_96889:71-2386(+)